MASQRADEPLCGDWLPLWTLAVPLVRKPALREAEAAVDDESLAGDEVRAGGEKEDGLSDVVRMSVAAHGGFGGEAGRL